MIAERSSATRKAVGVLKELSADERNRMILERREIERRDWVSIMGGAKQEGRKEGRKEVAINAINMGLDTATITRLTGLTYQDVENLRKML